MALLFAEYDIEVHLFDPATENVKRVLDQAKKAGLGSKVFHQKDYESLCGSLPSDSPKVFVLSVPHGSVGDKTIDGLEPFLNKGDVIMDASNERWTHTERRQERLRPKGVHFIGMGVSGGYQAARHGPSISPGGSTQEALDMVWPFLSMIAAKDRHGRPCTAKLGVGGCGHYVKMVHNGIEHGMMQVLCEIWGIMANGLGWSFEEIGDVFERWNTNKDSPLRSNFLIEIGAEICRKKDPEDETKYILSSIRDKVVQDVCEEEGTGTWTVGEAARLHVSAPTIAVSHMTRPCKTEAQTVEGKAKAARELRDATYACFLLCFVQGMHIIAAADAEHEWKLNYSDIMQLWRGGCIIQSDGIVDMLDEIYKSETVDRVNLLAHPTIAKELGSTMASLKELVISSLGMDSFVPALSASLEHFKYSISTDLPTSFQEAELDFFGHHMYDLKSESAGDPVMGKHHFEWRPARGIRDEEQK
ncbi:hypothetical protein M406DRAFT_62581 [Cryphonectria parasitica EP155]|uniref:phosphogluconate dehydrogenase (NADP(+)-dependent, decarboxylating) n=1 Tax=Cryphonectria parasitica (strain ATCC 38755 / EP155) TaxID=660469 RepID=A0A9P5CM92_CRYP1|nr:uncharacterized protein M406DRAFT_62581 [Cryphonectria parasitica EP155]KAF3764119.1 hypothetical protein M406DRAFT_62581 [Cryphonectria parasitica EP155]